uniref:Reverse transcriptase zinc-binding domain-containing protein n=1 Tax=Quercus lobata TaxID=97700 RepID=A0A7N2L7K0_QUELO
MGIPLECGWIHSYHPVIIQEFIYISCKFEDAKVSDLIDPVSREWDVNLLQGLFNPHEVELIMSIPLCRSYVEDKLVWPFTPLGTYIVRIGCRFLEKESSISLAPLNSNQDGGVWKHIWGLFVPNKVKNSIWRSCRDALPKKSNLRRRQILVDDACDHC